jgi:hypothetical protein
MGGGHCACIAEVGQATQNIHTVFLGNWLSCSAVSGEASLRLDSLIPLSCSSFQESSVRAGLREGS